jgi:hypothetical protein
MLPKNLTTEIMKLINPKSTKDTLFNKASEAEITKLKEGSGLKPKTIKSVGSSGKVIVVLNAK